MEAIYDHRLWSDSTLVAVVTARLDDTPEAQKFQYRDVRTIPSGRIIATLSDEKGDLMEEQSSRITLFGAYFQETLRPAPLWSLDLGLRYDNTFFDIDTN